MPNSIQFFKHFSSENRFDNQRDSIGYKKGGKFQSAHFSIGFKSRIKQQEEKDEFQETTAHKKKANLVFQFTSKNIKGNKNSRCKNTIHHIGKDY